MVLMILYQLSNIHGQLNLHDSNPMMNDNVLQSDCLYYYVQNSTVTYQDLADVMNELIPYCFRPNNAIQKLSDDFSKVNGIQLNFDQLRRINITALDLLSWSISIDLAERYQFYLNELNPSLIERFYNCTPPWFGDFCQYSFLSSKNSYIIDIVQDQFRGRVKYPEGSFMVAQLPCYVYLRCNRGGIYLCLDWREVCDGRVDCLDGAEDEIPCYELESNECADNEFRCYNGLCIPQEFWKDGLGETECLDRSDELHNDQINSCFQDPSFRCEEHSCRQDYEQFVCGDGQCVEKFHDCNNGRHSSLKEAMSARGTLPEKCWIAMVCLTDLAPRVNETSCEALQTNNSVLDYLNDCESLFQFPAIPIHFGHIHFLYERPQLRWNISKDLIPDYVCYDEQLCSFLIPNRSYENYSCLASDSIKYKMDYDGYSWYGIIEWIEKNFRGCSITHQTMDNKNKSSLLVCRNSSKSISMDRVLDNNEDCHLGDDENPPLSCSIINKYRVQCPDREHCLSPLLDIEECPGWDSIQDLIPFEQICDGIPRTIDVNKINSTEEVDCWNWPCDNMYSRCDNHRTCPDGRDELNCDQTGCPEESFACISPINHTVFCLPAANVGDTIVDCHGETDEPTFCQERYPMFHFHCQDSKMCLPWSKICDGVPDCSPFGDDEKICPKLRPSLCHENFISNRSAVEDLLCRLTENARKRYISVHTSADYPPLESKDHDKPDHWPKESHTMTDDIQSWDNYNPRTWPWLCNRGLLAHLSLENHTIDNRCLCPPSYYGDWCQYQNQRVSVTLKVIANNRSASYQLLLMLIDDNNEEQQIESHDQTIYISKYSCSLKLNRYLLYSERPKNISKNYSVRLHAYEKNQMKYVASWHFSISFLFLPVNRLAAMVTIPTTRTPILSDCVRPCKNGQCMKYFNKKQFFCQCSSGWSGIDCRIPIKCDGCSEDSICVGTSNNQPICVCPLTKFGPKCLLTSSCPTNACLNDGRCIPADITVAGSEYYCLCPEQFFGSRCENRRNKLDVTLDITNIPSYIIAYFISISDESKPISTIILQKLTLFQRTVTFHLSIPYNLVIIKSQGIFYLAVIQKLSRQEISTSINPSRACFPITSVFNSTMMSIARHRRIKFYHQPCQENPHLHCFLDEAYLCLCTNERHVNCMDFNYQQNLTCLENNWCGNEIECLQDHPSCPSTKICVCQGCFFGDRCQFYAKGFGLTLDEILGYEIQRNIKMVHQPFSVQLSAVVTMIMFLIGFINSIAAIFVFNEKTIKEVGCGIYLLASSVTSLIIVISFTVKFWILFFSHMDSSIRRYLVITSGFGLEILLKISLYTDNWLNAFVAAERVYTVAKGASFDKKFSRKRAKRVIYCLSIFIAALMVPQFYHLVVFDDEKEDRTWCVMRYSSWLEIYNLITISFHFIGPLLINVFSAIFIIITTARQRAALDTNKNCLKHLYAKLKQYKHLLISPLLLSILSLLHVSITFSMDCTRSSSRFWFHLLGYFLSFTSSVLFFIIFVFPSKIYTKEFKIVFARLQRRFLSSQLSFPKTGRR